MKTIKLVLLFLFSISCLNELQAHALWLETTHMGSIGAPHEVKVFFAEPGEKWEPLDGDEWQLVKGFELWLIKPNGNRSRLALSAKDNHYTASFTPESTGSYRLELKHENVGVLNFEKIPPFVPYFYATASVSVGNNITATPVKSNLSTQVLPEWNADSKVTALTISTKDNSKGKVIVIMPNGEKKDLGEVSSGKLAFEPQAQGQYQIELSVQDKKGGDLNGKAYKMAFYNATTIFSIP